MAKGKGKKRRSKKPYYMTRIKHVPLFGKTNRVTLVFAENLPIIASAAGELEGFPVAANDIFSVLNGYGNHDQPRGYNELSTLYDHWVVIGSRITVKFQAQAEASLTYSIGIGLKDDSTIYTNMDALMEDRLVTFTTLGTRSGAGAKQTLRSKFNAHQFWGSKDPLGNDKLWGTIAAGPSDGAFYQIAAQALDESSAMAALNVLVKVEYDVIYFEPNLPASS